MVKLQTHSINYSYGNHFSLKDIGFSIETGKICVIIGPNGSGKTTLIKYLSGIFGYKKKTMFIDGIDVSGLDEKEKAKRISYVPQIHETSFPYCALDMVLMGRNPHMGFFSMPNETDLKKCKNSLKQLGISHLQDCPYTDISGGEQKLVLIARAMAQEASVMILDEPTAHLDYRNKILILKKIRNLISKNDMAAFISLHDPNEAFIVADDIITIKEGHILHNGPVRNTLTKDAIDTLYDISVNIHVSGTSLSVIPSLDSIKDDKNE